MFLILKDVFFLLILLIVDQTSDILVLLLIIETKLRQESLLACLITLRALALACL